MSRSLIDQFESITDMVALEIKRMVVVTNEQMGERPYNQKRMNEKQELEAYNALRASDGGLYEYADGIRQELESRLKGVDQDTRLAKNLGPERIRQIAYILTLKYAARMKRLSEKLGIPLVERDPVPPMPEQSGAMEWPGSTISSMGSSTLSQASPQMADQALPPDLSSQPLLTLPSHLAPTTPSGNTLPLMSSPV